MKTNCLQVGILLFSVYSLYHILAKKSSPTLTNRAFSSTLQLLVTACKLFWSTNGQLLSCCKLFQPAFNISFHKLSARFALGHFGYRLGDNLTAMTVIVFEGMTVGTKRYIRSGVSCPLCCLGYAYAVLKL